MKKLFVIIIIVIILLGLGGFGYFLFRGQSKPVADTGQGTQTPGFTPFGEAPNVTTPGSSQQAPKPDTPNTSGDNATTPSELPKLRKLSSDPVAGVYASSSPTFTTFRYTERATGHVFETSSQNGNKTKLSNTTIPKVYEAFWNATGDGFLLRYQKDETNIITFFAKLFPSTATSSQNGSEVTPLETRGVYLPPNISELAVSPKRTQIFYLVTTEGGSTGYISAIDGSKPKQVFDSPVKGWVVDWPEDNTITLTTKATGVATGYMYSYNIKTGGLSRVLGQVRGLVAKMSHDGKYVFYSAAANNSSETHVFNIKLGKDEKTAPRTIADKCTWGTVNKNLIYCAIPSEIPSSMQPDSWYKGTTLFVDQVITIDADTGEVSTLADLSKQSSEFIDVMNPSIDNKEQYLTFMNKRDLSLWTLKIGE